ncbi:Dihydropteroate synthase [Buchnera aphidicola (Neophyllaphis podocarpi)]|uniref:dihydropteroate synthase n=1 Tax=Buchnera aphidicola TaxID=9 RepID=UPI00346425B7
MKIKVKNISLDLSNINVMGILNVTPDSFFDGGKYYSLPNSIDRAYHMISLGINILDIGGESTRPNYTEISEQEELDRVIPVLEAISSRFDIFISIDTSKYVVIKESIAKGAHMINDVRSFSTNESLKEISKSEVLCCIVHSKLTNSTIVNDYKYSNVLKEVYNFFSKKILLCETLGINRNRLILDPGFGFSKSIINNYQILSNIHKFKSFNLPLMVGMSRKSMITKLLDIQVSESLAGSLTCNIIAILKGINIIRTHDVKETLNAIDIIKIVKLFKDLNFDDQS